MGEQQWRERGRPTGPCQQCRIFSPTQNFVVFSFFEGSSRVLAGAPAFTFGLFGDIFRNPGAQQTRPLELAKDGQENIKRAFLKPLRPRCAKKIQEKIQRKGVKKEWNMEWEKRKEKSVKCWVTAPLGRSTFWATTFSRTTPFLFPPFVDPTLLGLPSPFSHHPWTLTPSNFEL